MDPRGSRVRLVLLDALAVPRELAAALALEVGPGQGRFVLPPAQTLPPALADPRRAPFAVVLDDAGLDDAGPVGAVVGAGVLDGGAGPSGLSAAVDAAGAVLLRGFLIAPAHQGRGLGTAAARAVPALAARLDPVPTAVLLTVNERNAAGLAAYARAGFTDVGRYLGGRSGPQRVMRAAVR